MNTPAVMKKLRRLLGVISVAIDLIAKAYDLYEKMR